MDANVAGRAIGSRDLARRLGMDESRVRRLAASGRLPGKKVGHDWVFDVSLIGEEFAKERYRGRPFSQAAALSLLFLASGVDPAWSEPSARSRLRRRLGSLAKLRPRLRSRAERRSYLAPDSARRQLRADPAFVLSGVSASDHYGMRIVAPDVLEGYAERSVIDAMVRRYAMEPVGEREANLVVHVVPRAHLPPGRFMPRAVVAADLADHADERTSQVGEAELSRSLK